MSGFTSENETTPEIPLCLSYDILIAGFYHYKWKWEHLSEIQYG